MKKLRIGMIGCGQIMPATASGILESRHCEMKGFFDIENAALEAAGVEYGLPTQNDLFKFLDDDGIDAVYIAVPHALHAAIAVEAMRAGKHVMIEKPMTTTPGDARFIVDEAGKTGMVAGVAMSRRLTGGVQKARELIGKGAIGDIASTRINAIGYKDEKYWSNGVGGRARRSTWRAFQGMAGGGILIMNAIHNLDAMYYMTGLKPSGVTALGGTYTAAAAVEDMIGVLISYENSRAYGVCEAMSSAFGAAHTDNTDVIYGTRGTIRFVGNMLSIYTTVEGLGIPTGVFTEIPVAEKKDRSLLMDDFAMAIRDGGKPLIPAEDGALIVGTICAAYRSLLSGKPESVI